MIDGLIRANAPAEVIEAAQSRLNRSNSEQCEVWEENAETFELFQGLTTQWKIADTNGMFLGLDYSAVIDYLKIMLPAEKVKTVFKEIQLMEFTVIPILNERNKQ